MNCPATVGPRCSLRLSARPPRRRRGTVLRLESVEPSTVLNPPTHTSAPVLSSIDHICILWISQTEHTRQYLCLIASCALPDSLSLTSLTRPCRVSVIPCQLVTLPPAPSPAPPAELVSLSVHVAWGHSFGNAECPLSTSLFSMNLYHSLSSPSLW